MEEPGFWDDPEVSQQVMKELKGLQDSVKEIEKLYSDYEDMMLLIEMSEEEDSEETAEEIEEELQHLYATTAPRQMPPSPLRMRITLHQLRMSQNSPLRTNQNQQQSQSLPVKSSMCSMSLELEHSAVITSSRSLTARIPSSTSSV